MATDERKEHGLDCLYSAFLAHVLQNIFYNMCVFPIWGNNRITASSEQHDAMKLILFDDVFSLSGRRGIFLISEMECVNAILD